MKKSALMSTVSVILCLLLIICPASAAAHVAEKTAAFELTDEDEDYLEQIKDEQIVLAATSEVMHFENADGEPVGALIPVIDLLGEWGLDISVIHASFEDSFDMLEAGSIDLMGMSMLNEEHRRDFYMTDTLYVSRVNIYTRIGEPLVNIVNIDYKTMGVLKRSGLSALIQGYLKPNTMIKEYTSVNELFEALQNGEIGFAMSTLNMQSEILRYPGVVYEMSLESMHAPQCVYSAKKDMEPLIGLINRYLESNGGAALIEAVENSRRDGIVQSAQMFYAEDIRYLQEHYSRLRVYDSGILYPVCYIENGEYKGLQIDINGIFKELTGMEIEMCPPENFKNGFITAIEEVQSGGLVGASSVYYNNECLGEPDLKFSNPILTDKLGLYALKENPGDIKDMRIGTTTGANGYVDWNTLTEHDPVIYGNRADLLRALQNGEVDAIFLSEMCVDYYYTIENSYGLRRIANLSASANVHMLVNVNNKSFNKLFNSSITLRELIYPGTRSQWLTAPQDYKFDFIHLSSELDETQRIAVIAVSLFAAAMAAAFMAMRYQLRKFNAYDRQISRMLSVQGNADMIWGNIRKKTLVSKGDFPILRRWCEECDTQYSCEEMPNKEEMLKTCTVDMEEIGNGGLPYYMQDSEALSGYGGKPRYVRRYTHKISEDEFMAFFLDITEGKYREQELMDIANTDYLSGLMNRRAMTGVLKTKRGRIENNGARVFVIMLDIDDFKLVNDEYGHEIGDNVLIGIAGTIRQNATPYYDAARWGGEEFLVVFESENEASAKELVGNILSEIRQTVFPVGQRASFTVTISCGLSELEADEHDYMDAVKRADRALYMAKEAGKDCVKTLYRHTEV